MYAIKHFDRVQCEFCLYSPFLVIYLHEKEYLYLIVYKDITSQISRFQAKAKFHVCLCVTRYPNREQIKAFFFDPDTFDPK